MTNLNARVLDDLPFEEWREQHHRQRGHGVHILLAMLGVALALGLFVASSTGLLDARASMLIVLCLGLLALPLIFMDPVHGLVVYAMMAPISLEFNFAGFSNLRVHDPLALLILAGIILQATKGARKMPKLKGKRILFLYLGTGIGVTLLGLALHTGNRNPNIFYALKIVQYVVIALAAGYCIRTTRDLRMVLGGFLAGLALLAGQLGYGTEDVAGRVTGASVAEKANVLSVYLAVAAAVVMGCADRVKDKLLLVTLLGLLAVAGYAMLLTQSRTGYASFGVVLVVALLTMRRKLIPLGVICVGAIALIAKPSLFARLKTLLAVFGIGADSSFDARNDAYRLIWKQTTNSPITMLFGKGRGVQDLGYADTQWGIEILYGGLLGLAVCIILVVGAIYLGYKTWKATRYRSDALGGAAQAGFLALVAAGVSTFGMTSWSSIRLAEAVFIMLGVVIATDKLLRHQDKRMGAMLNAPQAFTESEAPVVSDEAPRAFDY